MILSMVNKIPGGVYTLLVSVLIVGGLFLFSRPWSGSGLPDSYVSIRLTNETNQDIQNFWLGAGSEGGSTQDTTFGALRAGQTSGDYMIENVVKNYEKANFVINNKREFANDITGLLEGGKHYTFTLVMTDGYYNVVVTPDN